jgi:hypothetical protein
MHMATLTTTSALAPWYRGTLILPTSPPINHPGPVSGAMVCGVLATKTEENGSRLLSFNYVGAHQPCRGDHQVQCPGRLARPDRSAPNRSNSQLNLSCTPRQEGDRIGHPGHGQDPKPTYDCGAGLVRCMIPQRAERMKRTARNVPPRSLGSGHRVFRTAIPRRPASFSSRLVLSAQLIPAGLLSIFRIKA